MTAAACRTCFQATDQQFGELGFQVDVGHTSSSRAGRPGTSTPVGTPTTSPGALKAKKVPQNEEHGLVGHVEAAYTAHRSKEGRWGQTRRASESQGELYTYDAATSKLLTVLLLQARRTRSVDWGSIRSHEIELRRFGKTRREVRVLPGLPEEAAGC